MKLEIAIVLVCIVYLNPCQAAEGRSRMGSVADVRINGTAQGGTLTLTLIPKYTLPFREVQIETTAGESNHEIAKRLLKAVLNMTGGISIANPVENKIRIPGFINGQIGLKTTDAGLVSLPPLSNLKAAATKDKHVHLSWEIPTGTSYSKIFIWRSDLQGQIVAALAGDANTYTDTLKDLELEMSDYIPANLKYWIVAWNPSQPSEHVLVEIANPMKAIGK